MALQKTITDQDSALTVPDAYVRVDALHIHTSTRVRHADLVVGIYPSKTASDAARVPVRSYTVPVPDALYASLFAAGATDIRAAAYNLLKTLPEYAGAQDV